MSLKGEINSGHIPRSRFLLYVTDFGDVALTVINMSGLEEEHEEVMLPDRTRATSGEKPPVEFTVIIPSHHSVEVLAMDQWYEDSTYPAAANYKKEGGLTKYNVHGDVARTYSLKGLWCRRRATDELAMENAGEMDSIEYTISCDEVIRMT